MKKIIENKLNPLIGLKLSMTTRALNMECLKFGYKEKLIKNGRTVNVGEYGLHIQCEWRVIKGDKMIIGSKDLYEPIVDNGWDENFDYEKGNLRDTKINDLITNTKLLVQEIEADTFGGVTIKFSGNYEIQIIPLKTSKSEYNEYWRLLNNKDESENHFVIGQNEIENA